jgi:uncharacterized membrane protein YjjP (DUF1212 family)
MSAVPATGSNSLPGDPTRPVDDALHAAAILLECGVSGQAVSRTAGQIAGEDVTGPHARIRFVLLGDLVAVAAARGHAPWSLIRPVGVTKANLELASAVEELGERVASGEIASGDVAAELDRIEAIESPYGAATTTIASGVAGFAFAMLLGAAPQTAVLAVVACIAGSLVQHALRGWRLPPPVVIFTAALAASGIAAAGIRAGFAPLADSSTLPAITWLIPGLAIINGLLDLLSIRYITLGLHRTLTALITFLLIGAAVAVGVTVAGGS